MPDSSSDEGRPKHAMSTQDVVKMAKGDEFGRGGRQRKKKLVNAVADRGVMRPPPPVEKVIKNAAGRRKDRRAEARLVALDDKKKLSDKLERTREADKILCHDFVRGELKGVNDKELKLRKVLFEESLEHEQQRRSEGDRRKRDGGGATSATPIRKRVNNAATPHARKPLEFCDTEVLESLPFHIIHSNDPRKLMGEFDLACDESVPSSDDGSDDDDGSEDDSDDTEAAFKKLGGLAALARENDAALKNMDSPSEHRRAEDETLKEFGEIEAMPNYDSSRRARIGGASDAAPYKPKGDAAKGDAATLAAPTGAARMGAAPTGAAPTGDEPQGESPTGKTPTGKTPTGKTPTGMSMTPPGDEVGVTQMTENILESARRRVTAAEIGRAAADAAAEHRAILENIEVERAAYESIRQQQLRDEQASEELAHALACVDNGSDSPSSHGERARGGMSLGAGAARAARRDPAIRALAGLEQPPPPPPPPLRPPQRLPPRPTAAAALQGSRAPTIDETEGTTLGDAQRLVDAGDEKVALHGTNKCINLWFDGLKFEQVADETENKMWRMLLAAARLPPLDPPALGSNGCLSGIQTMAALNGNHSLRGFMMAMFIKEVMFF